MRTASYLSHELVFKRPGGTSRGVLHTKETWFLVLRDGDRIGIGECGLLRGLSMDDCPDYEQQLDWTCRHIHLPIEELLQANAEFPSIRFGIETAFLSLHGPHPMAFYPSDWTKGETGIRINGLVWMGDADFMQQQVEELLERGFRCIKLKIGAIDFDKECAILGGIRDRFDAKELMLRVDANGAFDPAEAMEKLKTLSSFDLHSIEQPIAKGQWEELADLCEQSPVPIALDEELIGLNNAGERERLIEATKPQYLVLKPSLLGGMAVCDHWIELAEQHHIDWWITSALESNVGLNAIAQYTLTKHPGLHQGLGTGSLFTNNVPSPLSVRGEQLFYDPALNWDLSMLSLSDAQFNKST